MKVCAISDPGLETDDPFTKGIAASFVETDEFRMVRVQNIYDLLKELTHVLKGKRLDRLDLVGHGNCGRLRLGSPTHGKETIIESSLQALEGLRELNPLFADDEGCLRLLGCDTGLIGPTGSGPVLQLALSTILRNRPVFATLDMIQPSDFDHGTFNTETCGHLLSEIRAGGMIDTSPKRGGRMPARMAPPKFLQDVEVLSMRIQLPRTSPSWMPPLFGWSKEKAPVKLVADAIANRSIFEPIIFSDVEYFVSIDASKDDGPTERLSGQLIRGGTMMIIGKTDRPEALTEHHVTLHLGDSLLSKIEPFDRIPKQT